MNLQRYLKRSIIISLCVRFTLECTEVVLKNVSCDSIKTEGGYKFPYEPHEGSEIEITDNETMIANAVPGGKPHNFTTEVKSFDDNAVITKQCRDLRVKHIIVRGNFVKEICEIYKVTGKSKNPKSSDLSGLWYLVVIGVIGIIVTGILCWWRSRRNGSTLPWPCRSKGRRETRRPKGGTDPDVTASNGETRHGSDVRSEIPSESDPRGSGEDDPEEDGTLKCVHVHSTDSKANGKTARFPSLDRTFSVARTLQAENGDLGAPDIDSASCQRAMDRRFRDDPGEVNNNEGRDITGRVDNGWAACGHDAEAHETEGRPLLSTERADIQDFEMQGEAIPLVNKRGSDLDRASRCPTAPETDVESTPNMSN